MEKKTSTMERKKKNKCQWSTQHTQAEILEKSTIFKLFRAELVLNLIYSTLFLFSSFYFGLFSVDADAVSFFLNVPNITNRLRQMSMRTSQDIASYNFGNLRYEFFVYALGYAMTHTFFVDFNRNKCG